MSDYWVGRRSWGVNAERLVAGGDDLDEGGREEKRGEEINILRHGSGNECAGWMGTEEWQDEMVVKG